MKMNPFNPHKHVINSCRFLRERDVEERGLGEWEQ